MSEAHLFKKNSRIALFAEEGNGMHEKGIHFVANFYEDDDSDYVAFDTTTVASLFSARCDGYQFRISKILFFFSSFGEFTVNIKRGSERKRFGVLSGCACKYCIHCGECPHNCRQ